MVYNWQNNKCSSTVVGITAGSTTTLPPGSPATVTQTGTYPNYSLHFGIPAGTPGGSLSYPGMTTDNNNGTATQGKIFSQTMVQAPVVDAASSTGYRQNGNGAASHSRDEVLQITVTLKDMPGCAISGLGQLDEQICFNAAIHYLSSYDDNVQKRLIVPGSQYPYQFINPGYQQPLPHDFGDYHGFAGYVTQASVMLQVVNGKIGSCQVFAGSGYAPNAKLPVYVTDSTLQGSGGYATVQTDASGTPTGCTIVQAGMNYPPRGVVAQVVPLGGDLAVATAVLSSNTFSTGQNPIIITPPNGGSGYAHYTTTTVPVNAAGLTIAGTGLVCTSYPSFTATLTGSSVSSVNVVTSGTNCTYAGSANATVPLVFGASCGGAQCTLLTPEAVNNMPCGVALINNLTIEGVGNPVITTNWDRSSANTSQMIAFCEPTGQQSTNITIKNLTIDDAFMGFYFPLEVHHLTMDNVTFGIPPSQVAFPIHVFSFSGGTPSATTINHTTNNTNVGADPPALVSVISNITDYGDSGITCGGEWIGRSGAGYAAVGGSPVGPANTMPGGYQTMLLGAWYQASSKGDGFYSYGHVNNFDAVSPCGNVRVENWVFKPFVSHSTSTDNLDAFWEQYIWKTQNGPANSVTFTNASNFLSNGLASVSNGGLGCKFLQTVTDRTVDYQFGNAAAVTSSPGNVGNYPFYQCFSPITYSPFVFTPRYSGNTSVTNPMMSFTNVYSESYSVRPIITGRFDDLNVSRVSFFGKGAFTDPYQQASEARAAINMTSRKTSSSFIRDVTSVPSSPTFSPMYQNLVSGFASNVGQHILNIQNTPFTSPAGVTGCSLSSLVGGAGETPWHMAGSFVSGATTCTVVITPGSTATGGWRCSGTDIGTQATLGQSVTGTTSCTITGTTTIGHVVTWSADAY
jgi:hypothetical protein